MAIQLTNRETAEKFEAVTSVDQWVWVPKSPVLPGNCYRGMISNINPEAAARYVHWQGNLIKSKQPVATTSALSAIMDIAREEVQVKKKRNSL